jgi:hypothetical protein
MRRSVDVSVLWTNLETVADNILDEQVVGAFKQALEMLRNTGI